MTNAAAHSPVPLQPVAGWPALQVPTRAVDQVARALMRRFFLAGDKPRYVRIAQAWRDAAAPYSTQALCSNPGSFYPDVQAPAGAVRERFVGRLPAGQRLDIAFPSPYRTYVRAYAATYATHKENATVHARLWIHKDPRPTVLCLHGWLGGMMPLEEQLFAVKQLYTSGLNVVLMVLPLHGPRRPPSFFDGNLFPSTDLRRTNEAFGQAVTDTRTLLAWIRTQGVATRLGLLGFSLGGYVSAIIASLEPHLDFVVPMMAPASLGDVVWGLVREHAQKHADFDVTLLRQCLMVHCPLSHALRVPRRKVALVHGYNDVLVGPTQLRALWHHWHEPTVLPFAGGHCIHLGRQHYLSTLCTMMAGKRPPADQRKTRHVARWLQHMAWHA